LKPGRLFAVYVAGYALLRFFVERLRIDEAKSAGGLRLNQWVSVVVFAAAVAFLATSNPRDASSSKNDATTTE